jgi:hypothetical protein
LNPQASTPEQLVKEMRFGYSGEMVVGRYLDVY